MCKTKLPGYSDGYHTDLIKGMSNIAIKQVLSGHHFVTEPEVFTKTSKPRAPH